MSKLRFSFSLETIRYWMIYLNMIIIVFFGSVYLFATKYIIENQLARNFLEEITGVPHRPFLAFLNSSVLYCLLVVMIFYRDNHPLSNRKWSICYSTIELALCILMNYFIYMGYNGVILLIFCDCIFHIKDDKTIPYLFGIMSIVYFFSSYDISSIFLDVVNPSVYFDVFNGSIRNVLRIISNVFVNFNSLLFIVFMIVYIKEQIKHYENMQEEMAMVNQVNENLKSYAAITEKIGENNERKRLAREIHDTLGHALTGIAAGLDASIAMIDLDPKKTKDQLVKVRKVVIQGIQDVRNSLNKLRPGALEKHSFKQAIELMIEEFTSVSDLEVQLEWGLDSIDFETTKEDVLFRLIQESITNSIRHGGATLVKIKTWIQEEWMYMEITDNGAGCGKIQYGFGLTQMQERVSIIHGKISFSGEDGFKTTVKIPLLRGEHYD